MILGPDDPRAITDPDELEEIRQATELWNAMLGVRKLTKAQKAKYDAEFAHILDIIHYKHGDQTGRLPPNPRCDTTD